MPVQVQCDAMKLSQKQLEILTYLAATHERDPRAEVPLQELEHELELNHEEARAAVADLVAAGLAQADLFPVNVWAQITDEGLAICRRVAEGGPA